MIAVSPAWAVPLSALLAHSLPVLPGWPSRAGLLVLSVALYAGLGNRRPRSAWFVLLAGVTFTFVVWQADSGLGRRLPAGLEGVDLRVQGVVRGAISRHGHGITFRFGVERCERPGGRARCSLEGDVRLGWYGRAPLAATLWPGDRLALNVRLKRPVGVVNPGGFDRERWALQHGVVAVGYVRRDRPVPTGFNGNTLLGGVDAGPEVAIAQARMQAEHGIGEVLADSDPRARGVVTALVTGRQAAIAPALWDLFNRTGTSHLMSISGLHVTMFAAMTLWLVRRLLRLPWPAGGAVLLRIPAPTLAWALAVPAAFAYAAFSGWGVPAQRTCWMLLVAGAAVRMGRTGRLEAVMALAAAVVTLLDPWAVTASGFWLSFATVAAIVAVGAPGRPGHSGGWREGVRAQWAASLVLVPLAGFWFGAIPVAGPLANAVAIPLVSSFITPLAMGGAAIASLSETAAWLPLWMATVATRGLIAVLGWIDALPLVLWTTGSSSWTSLVLAAAGAWLVLTPARPVSRLAAATLMLPLLVGRGEATVDGHWSMQVIDVGQGTAVLVRTARHTLLYDTGPTYGREGEGAGDRIIAPWLRHQGIHRLDRLVLSHEDRDHSGGAAELIRQFDVAGLSSALPEGHDLRALAVAQETCTRGQRWQWDGVHFEMLHPGPDAVRSPVEERSNARSCVLRISSPAGSALLTGDIEKAQETHLARLYGNAGLGSDVLLVPHHGSGTSSSAAFLDAVAPAVAIVQAGYRNRYRHPAARVVARYRTRGIELLRTDHAGAIAIRFEAGRRPLIHRARTDGAPYWRIVTAPPAGSGSH